VCLLQETTSDATGGSDGDNCFKCERSKAVFAGVFARARVRVFVARFCEVLERFESGFERKFKKVPRECGKENVFMMIQREKA